MNNKKQYYIGIDIGGTNMKAGLFDGEKIIADFLLGTPKDNFDHFMIMLNALIEPLIKKAKEDKIKINSIGAGVAGVINSTGKQVLNSPNIPIINNRNIVNELEKISGLPVIIDNDVNCFVRAETILGATQKYKNIYGIIIGTGIGGGWWLNGENYKGVHNGGGEPGKMIIDFNSGIKLEEAYHKLTQNNPSLLAEEAYRGDILAEKSYEEVGSFIGIAIANIINIIDPEVIVLGGGVMASSDLFLSKIKKSMREYIISSEIKKNIKILKSKLGKNAGIIGAALLSKKS